MFFDCLGIEYKYQKEYGEVSAGRGYVYYKPDFLLPGLSKYVEIKPSRPLGIEHTKCAAWTRDIGDIYVLFNLNAPTENNENGFLYDYDETMKGPPLIREGQCWCECPKCGKIDLEECGEITSCGCFSTEYYNQEYDKTGASISMDRTHTERLIKAYKEARNRKFDGKGKRKAPRVVCQLPLF